MEQSKAKKQTDILNSILNSGISDIDRQIFVRNLSLEDIRSAFQDIVDLIGCSDSAAKLLGVNFVDVNFDELEQEDLDLILDLFVNWADMEAGTVSDFEYYNRVDEVTSRLIFKKILQPKSIVALKEQLSNYAESITICRLNLVRTGYHRMVLKTLEDIERNEIL